MGRLHQGVTTEVASPGTFLEAAYHDLAVTVPTEWNEGSSLITENSLCARRCSKNSTLTPHHHPRGQRYYYPRSVGSWLGFRSTRGSGVGHGVFEGPARQGQEALPGSGYLGLKFRKRQVEAGTVGTLSWGCGGELAPRKSGCRWDRKGSVSRVAAET